MLVKIFIKINQAVKREMSIIPDVSTSIIMDLFHSEIMKNTRCFQFE